MSIVIVGAGHAAAQCIMNLRREGVDSPIILVGDEPCLPYMRPPLSKAFLQGAQTAEQLLIKPESFYQDNHVEFVQAKATNIDSVQKHVLLDNGNSLSYSALILATGAKLRQLSIPGAELKGIHYLKTLAEAESLKNAMANAKRVVVCGGGYIGLEVAASAKQAGLDVTVVELGERVMQRVVTPVTSEYYTRLHQSHGVKIECQKTVSSFLGDTHIEQVVCTDGESYDTDLVVVGIGVAPETQLAKAAGLGIDNGILVDEFCQSSQQAIYAMGDCANHFNNIYQRRLRLECVQNANGQAKTIAGHIAGKSIPYNELPWFWSDQYQAKLQIAGISEDYDDLIVRGNVEEDKSVTVLALKDNVVIAAEVIANPKDFLAAKTLITKAIEVDKVQLADKTRALNSFLT